MNNIDTQGLVYKRLRGYTFEEVDARIQLIPIQTNLSEYIKVAQDNLKEMGWTTEQYLSIKVPGYDK